MNGFDKSMMLPDVQSSADSRHIAIDQVGIKSVRYPVTILCSDGQVQPSVAMFDFYVSLSADVKGTHMSRFMEMLFQHKEALSTQAMRAMMEDMLVRLESAGGIIRVKAPFFVKKKAPVSGVESLMDYEVSWEAVKKAGQPEIQVTQTVLVPVQSLCPCSKEISEYGAHNQRSHATIGVVIKPGSEMAVEELIRVAEQNASCELWSLLKRPDEKYVTEKAYENPKFVEDLVRSMAQTLNKDARIASYKVEAENFESIHNHSAYAYIESAGN